MPAWKTIASLFGFSICTALLGSACTAEVQEAAGTTEPEGVAEETAQQDLSTSAAPIDINGRGNDRDRDRRRCEDSCRDRADRCMREGRGDRNDRERRCRREREDCISRCGRR